MASIAYTEYIKPTHRRIRYTYTDDYLIEHKFGPVITTDVGYDPAVEQVAIQAKIEERLKEQEVETWLDDEELAVIADYATKQRHASTWRARYKDAVRDEHFRLGYKLYRDYLLGNFTDAQLRTAFSMTQIELDDFMSRVLIAHDQFVIIKAGVGE